MSDYTIENCPNCEEDVCNGMGPATMPRVTWLLQKTNTAKFFVRECNMHDMDCHLQIGFEESSKLFKSRLRARVKATKFKGNWFTRFAKRRWFNRIVYVIAWSVTGKAGLDAYDKGACKKLVKS